MSDGQSHGSRNGISDAKQLAYLIERRRYSDAGALLSKLLASQPDDPILLFYAAKIDYLENRNDTALETVQRVLAVDPDNEPARRLLFFLYDGAERHAEAEIVVIDLIRDFPEEADYYAMYAQLMLATLNLDKAAALARESVRIDPDNANALAVSILCAFVNDPTPEMERRLHELVRRYPDSAETAFTLLNLLAQQSRYREAYPLAQELLREEPYNQSLIDMVVSLKVEAHWSMVPLWPLRRFGWAASGVIWLAMVVAVTILSRTPLAYLVNSIVAIFLIYVVYSWGYPPLLTKLLKRQ